MKVDIFSLIQDGQRRLSYMSQTLGLMADLDLGTEYMRFLGSTLAFILRILRITRMLI